MSAAAAEAAAPGDGPPPPKSGRPSLWAGAAAAAVLAALLLLASVGSTCRRGSIASPWCPEAAHVVSLERFSPAGRAARLWGKPIASADFADLPANAECNRLLDMPRVAIMFLARGDMYHEKMWAKWFAGAAGLVPRPTLQEYGCSGTRVLAVRKACSVNANAPVLEQQFLFNVYYHPAPNYTGPATDNVFYGHKIPDRLDTDWGSSNLTMATRHMMRHALRDPHAQQFILLSDTGVPLYPPTTVYLQLMSESRSRINACPEGAGTGRGPGWWEWPHSLEASGVIPKKFWRKNAQWVGLRRPHVEAIMKDKAVHTAFEQHCKSYFHDGKYYQCKVDEHYFSTFLATQGRDFETDCKGYLVTSNWTVPGRHSGGPYEYFPPDISAELFERLRVDIDWGEKGDPSTCVGFAALEMGERGFVSVAQLDASSCQDPFGGSYSVLTQECPMFARKFPADTAAEVLAVLSNSTNGLGILLP